MANTRQAAKRARQADQRRDRNRVVKVTTKKALKKVITAIAKKDTATGPAAYVEAIKKLSTAASKGVIPKGRAARKISRLTKLAKKELPQALNFKN